MKFNVKFFGYLLISLTVVQASRLIRSENSTSLNSTTLNSTTLADITTTTDLIKNGNCDLQTKQFANQAIDEAIAMVQAVREVWKHYKYRPVLYKYMGRDCMSPRFINWIDGRLSPNEWE